MNPSAPDILAINGGSSSIRFALFEAGGSLRRILEGALERIGLPDGTLRVKGLNQADNFSRLVTTPDHTVAVGVLTDMIEDRVGRDALAAVGHRVVHGGLDTLVFAGGIGENAPTVRSRVCEGLGFLGIELDDKCNAGNEGVISSETSRIAVRIIHADEEWMIASAVCRVLGLTIDKEHNHAKKQDEDDG